MSQETGDFPTVTAIIVTYHSGPALRECLYALAATENVTEIIIVNNGNSERAEAWLRYFVYERITHQTVKLLDGQGNIGFGRANNLAAKEASGDRLLIINPDAVICRKSIEALEAAHITGRSPCLVGGKLFGVDGNEQKGGRRELLTIRSAIVSFTGLSKLEKIYPGFRSVHRENDPEPKGPVPMPVISGAFCYTSANDFQAIGGFDEDYFLHVEDIDICWRVRQHNGEVVYTPLARVMHYGSTSKVSASFVEWHKAKGLALYFHKRSKTIIGRTFSRASFVFFASVLIGRSFLIRKILHKLR